MRRALLSVYDKSRHRRARAVSSPARLRARSRAAARRGLLADEEASR